MRRKNKTARNFVILIVVSAIFLMIALTQCENLKITEAKPLRINEVMSSNKTIIADEDGDYSDYIEIYNNSSKDINLKGYSLSDSASNIVKWKFPDVTIKAGQYLIVFASSKDKVEEDGYTCHTNYKLTSQGERIILSSPAVASVDEITVPELAADISYGIVEDGGEDDGIEGKLISASPGKRNGGKRPDSVVDPNSTGDPNNPNAQGTGQILINEYMPRNSHTCYDSEGSYGDWVEFYNPTDAPVNLSGYCLTSNQANYQKWSFPNVTIEAKGYLLIWLSGKDKVIGDGGNEVHANFKLGETDIILILSTADGRIVDSIPIEYLTNDISKGRTVEDTSKWVYYARPTPGGVNDSTGYDQLLNATSLSAKGLWISETSNANVPYNNKDVSDWIELYNGTNETVNLQGYGLSIDLADKYTYRFGNQSIAAGEYLIVYAPGKTVPNKFKTKLYTNFNLSSKGETVYLTDTKGNVLDAYDTGRVSLGYTSGRIGTGEDVRYFFTQATPGAANSSTKYTTYSAKPQISNEGGYVASGTIVTLSVPEGLTIYYTTDGSNPTSASMKYSQGISITKNSVIKAIAIKEGMLPSDVVTATYFVGKTHSIPIISISMKSDDFYGHTNGLYAKGPGYNENKFPYWDANFGQDWERKMTFEYYDPNGTKKVEFDAGLKIFGQYSRGYDQKSMSVHMRGDYGAKSVTYPFFKDNDIKTASNFVIRSGGQDYKQTIIRDAFCGQVMKGFTNTALMDWQPVVVYINGEYFGYYNLREKVNESYLNSHYGIDEDNVDIIKGNSTVVEGTIDNYNELINYVKTHDLSNSEYYKTVENWVDIDNYIDYLVATSFFAGQDTGNVKFYRERKEGAKWQWVIFDFDQALRNDWPNAIGKIFDPAGHGHNKAFRSTLQCALLKSPTFRERFIQRYANHLNTTFKTERMSGILENMTTQISGEIADECAKWGWPKSLNEWTAQVNSLKNIVNNRRKIAAREFRDFFKLSDARMTELIPDWAQLK